MPKRKVVSESDKAPKKKLKSESTTKGCVSKLSFDSPEQCLRSLIYPTSLEDFFAKYWEKEPLFIARKDQDYYKDFPTKAKLEEIAKKEQLEYDKDLFLSQDEIGMEVIEHEERATVKSIQKCFKEKLTLLFTKPHRFHEELYQFLQLLEGYFGCCVNCFLEVHTENAHGRKPGFTGKEEFILQIEGKKRWCLFEPIQKLAFLDSEDLSKDKVGEKSHEFVLEPGDMLYFPRGVVYQAHSLPDEVSCHVSVELYEEYSWGHFLSNILDNAVNDALEKDIAFREGLPVNFLSYMGFGKKDFSDHVKVNETENSEGKGVPKAVVPNPSKIDLEHQMRFKEKLEKLLSSLGQYLDPHWGADAFFGKTFVDKCLAPSHDGGKPSDTEQPPNDESLVQMKHREYVRITFYEPAEDNEDDDESEAEESLGDGPDGEEEKESEKKTKKPQKDKNVNGKEGHARKKSQKSKAKSDVKENEDEKEDENMASDDDEELDGSYQDEPCIILYHPLNNKVEPDDEDMDDDEKENTVEFPGHYRDALLILHRSATPVALRDLPLTPEERVELAVTLWCEGLLMEVEKS